MLICKHDLKHGVGVKCVSVGAADTRVRPCSGDHLCYLRASFEDFNAFFSFLFKQSLIGVEIDVTFRFYSPDCAKNIWCVILILLDVEIISIILIIELRTIYYTLNV